MNNAEFLQGLRDQDPEAVKHLTECYLPSVWRFVCAKVGNDQHLADDIVSESVLALIKAASSQATIEYPGAWLRTVAGRRVQDHFRAAARVKHLMDQVKHVTPEADENDALQIQLLAERRQEVIEIMDSLPPAQRTVLEWKYIEKLSVRVIAQRLNATEKSVEAMLFRARQKFKKFVAARDAQGSQLSVMRNETERRASGGDSEELRRQQLKTGFEGS